MSFKKEIHQFKYFYFEIWRGSEKPSPAFNNEIIKITWAGWRHVTSSPKRGRHEVVERIRLLVFAKKLIEESTFIQTYRQEGNIEYWSIQGLFNNQPVRVVIRAKDKGLKHFYSVFAPVPKIHYRHKITKKSPKN